VLSLFDCSNSSKMVFHPQPAAFNTALARSYANPFSMAVLCASAARLTSVLMSVAFGSGSRPSTQTS
jgi:hypothetical protein